MKSIGMALVLILAAAGAQAAEEPSDGAAWYSIVTGEGVVIGHASQAVIEHSDGRETVDFREVLLAADEGAPVRQTTRTVTREDADGRTVSIDSTSRTGRRWSHDFARFGEDKAVITHETRKGRRTVTVPLPPTVRFDGGEGLLAGWDPAAAPQLEFHAFSVEDAEVERVVIQALPGAPPGQPGGLTAIRMRYDGDAVVGLSRLILDRDRHIVSVDQPMFGAAITLRAADKETATAPHPPYRPLTQAMVKSPFRISASAREGHIRYRFGFRGGLAFPLPQTGEQRVTVKGGVTTLDICEGCGPGLATDPATLADARKPTAWMQSDDPRLKRIAGPVAERPVSDARKMEILTEIARRRIAELDMIGHYSALEALSRRAGDCTESAVLLAALGRAAGIPTRVANGLIYTREFYHGASNAFMPHNWVLAYVDGEWRSYDAGVAAFDATHIALTVGDGDAKSISAARQLAGLLDWQGMVEIKPRPEA